MKMVYLPPENEPAVMKIYGRTWKANVPQDVKDDDGYTIMESVRTLNPDGTSVLTSRERKVSILEIARGHPMFQVGDEPKEARKQRWDVEDVETATHYRAYAQQWFKEETSLERFQERWDDEEGLRERAGVSDDDISFLKTFMGPRLRDLQNAARDERIQARMSR